MAISSSVARVVILDADGNPIPVASFSKPSRVQLYTTNTNVAASAFEESAFFNVSARDRLSVVRGAAPGAGVYAFEIDWSRDGVAAEATQVLATTPNAVTNLDLGGLFARFRVRNTDAVVAFTGNPRTTVYAR